MLKEKAGAFYSTAAYTCSWSPHLQFRDGQLWRACPATPLSPSRYCRAVLIPSCGRAQAGWNQHVSLLCVQPSCAYPETRTYKFQPGLSPLTALQYLPNAWSIHCGICWGTLGGLFFLTIWFGTQDCPGACRWDLKRYFLLKDKRCFIHSWQSYVVLFFFLFFPFLVFQLLSTFHVETTWLELQTQYICV